MEQEKILMSVKETIEKFSKNQSFDFGDSFKWYREDCEIQVIPIREQNAVLIHTDKKVLDAKRGTYSLEPYMEIIIVKGENSPTIFNSYNEKDLLADLITFADEIQKALNENMD